MAEIKMTEIKPEWLYCGIEVKQSNGMQGVVTHLFGDLFNTSGRLGCNCDFSVDWYTNQVTWQQPLYLSYIVNVL